MKAYALLLCLLLLVLAACGGGDNDDLNADGDPLTGGDGFGVMVDNDDDASAVAPSDRGDDIFGSDSEGGDEPSLNENTEDGALFTEESGAGD
jgi:hypothetical protein